MRGRQASVPLKLLLCLFGQQLIFTGFICSFRPNFILLGFNLFCFDSLLSLALFLCFTWLLWLRACLGSWGGGSWGTRRHVIITVRHEGRRVQSLFGVRVVALHPGHAGSDDDVPSRPPP